MKKLSIIIIFNVLFFTELYSQTDYYCSVLTKGTRLTKQIHNIYTSFPNAEIKDYLSKGYFVTDLTNIDGTWSLLVSKGTGFEHQLFSFTEQFPKKIIDVMASEDHVITELIYAEKHWAAIYTKGTRFKKQSYFYDSYFPEGAIKSAMENGYEITQLQYCNSLWIILLSQSIIDTHKQKLLFVDDFNNIKIADSWKAGEYISEVTTNCIDSIVLVMNIEMLFSNQEAMIYNDNNYSSTNFTDKWNSRYRITNLLAFKSNSMSPSLGNNDNYISRFSVLTQRPDSNSIDSYKNIISEYAPDELAYRAVQRLSGIYIEKKEWDSVIGIYNQYRKLFPNYKNIFDKTIDIMNTSDEQLFVSNLGREINSDYDEYAPVVSTDGKKLYFCRNNDPNGFGGEDIYMSKRNIDDSWATASNLGITVNTQYPEAPTALSADGLTLTVIGNYHESFGRGDIFYFEKYSNGWSNRKHFPKKINSEYFESDICITSDGSAMFFVSDRPKGFRFVGKDEFSKGITGGDLDIYVVLKTNTGFSEPINLGDVINTPYVDRAPFLHPDGKTLYFSSSGHYGLGKLDVFKSVRLDPESWTEWSEPVNLGKEINTVDSDWFYRVSTDGNHTFFSGGASDSFGGQDIYMTSMPEAMKPERVITIIGKVIDEKGMPLDAKIVWESLETGKIEGELRSDPKDGDYFIALPIGKKYGIYAEKEGYYPNSNSIDLSGTKYKNDQLIENIKLTAIEELKNKDISIGINNIFFKFESILLLPTSYPELNRLAKFVFENPDVKVEISGHTDSIGEEYYNLWLSQKRAAAVTDYLISAGCPKDALSAVGYGEEKPIDTNKSRSGRRKNRRVEFKIK